MDNSLNHKPDYTAHRRGVTAADSADLAALETSNGRGAINAKGYSSIHGFVEFNGGTTPTVTLQPLERVAYVDAAGAEQKKLVARGSNIGPLSAAAGVAFSLDTPGGGAWLFRIEAVTGAPTGVEVYLAGGTRASEGSI